MAQQKGMKRAEKVAKRKKKLARATHALNLKKMAAGPAAHAGHDHAHDHDHDHDHEHEEKKEKKAAKPKAPKKKADAAQ